MRNPCSILSRTTMAVLLSAVLASTSALAGMQHSHSSTDDFVWSVDDQLVNMHSTAGTGVIVDRTNPASFHGLQAGDVILSIDKQHLARVSDLLNALRDHGKSPATLQVRRAGAELAVHWTYVECQALVPVPVPVPPPPPPPPPHY